jgi:chemotaxis protein methyltransferase CheR
VQSPEILKPLVAIPVIGSVPLVTDALLTRFAEMIYRRAGIRVSPQKKMLLSNRLRRRLRDTGIASFEDYYEHLVRLPAGNPEWDAFLQEITTHETYLFRDETHWRWFARQFLAEVTAEPGASGSPAGPGDSADAGDGRAARPRPAASAPKAKPAARRRSLRIWSAACSTGDEAVTAACCVAAGLQNLAEWQVQILGTDIGVGAVQQAQSGVFGERAMRLVSEELRRRFFTKARDVDVWQAKPAIMRMVSFRQHNLLERLREPPFDLVFLKNVLIYFDKPSKKTVLDNVRDVLRPGGFLVAGAAEGVGDLVKDLVRVEPWLFRRPFESRH